MSPAEQAHIEKLRESQDRSAEPQEELPETTPPSIIQRDVWNDPEHRMEHYRILRNGPIGKHTVLPARTLATILHRVRRKFPRAERQMREHVAEIDRLPMLACQLGMLLKGPVSISGTTYAPNATAAQKKRYNTLGHLLGALEAKDPLSASTVHRRLTALFRWKRVTRQRQYDREWKSVRGRIQYSSAGPFIPPQRKNKSGKLFRHCVRKYPAGYVASIAYVSAPALRDWYNVPQLHAFRMALLQFLPEAWKRKAHLAGKPKTQAAERAPAPRTFDVPKGIAYVAEAAEAPKPYKRSFWRCIRASNSERAERQDRKHMRLRAQKHKKRRSKDAQKQPSIRGSSLVRDIAKRSTKEIVPSQNSNALAEGSQAAVRPEIQSSSGVSLAVAAASAGKNKSAVEGEVVTILSEASVSGDGSESGLDLHERVPALRALPWREGDLPWREVVTIFSEASVSGDGSESGLVTSDGRTVSDLHERVPALRFLPWRRKPP